MHVYMYVDMCEVTHVCRYICIQGSFILSFSIALHLLFLSISLAELRAFSGDPLTLPPPQYWDYGWAAVPSDICMGVRDLDPVPYNDKANTIPNEPSSQPDSLFNLENKSNIFKF